MPEIRRSYDPEFKSGAVRIAFELSGRIYGSPRVHARLRADGERVSKKTVAASMARQGLVGPPQTVS